MRTALILGLLTLPPLFAQSGWTLVWQDEFDGPALDTAKWGYDTGGNGWGNGELEYYTNRPENAYTKDGMLVIKAMREDYGGRQYTSARLLTKGKFTQKYGRIEARIKVPYGMGIWPAFWMLGDDIDRVSWPACGEIDIMENIGRQPAIAYGTIHAPGYDIGGTYTLAGSGRFADDFHVFAAEWEATEIRLYVDGILYKTIKSSDIPAGTRWVFDHPFFIILNVAVGGRWPLPPDASTVFPQYMYVDYVRVYQRATAGSAPVIDPQRGVVNGASFQTGFAPGSWATIGGAGLASSTRTWRAEDFDGVNLPTELDGVSATFNGKPAFVGYISPTQINVQAPDTGPGPVLVEVLNNHQLSERVTAQAAVSSPAFFLWDGRYAVATHLDFTLAAKPGLFSGLDTVAAKPGEWIIFWGTGFGPTVPPMPAGQLVDSSVQHTVTADPVVVTINNEQAQFLSAVLSPGYAGLCQIAVQLPGDLPDGDLPVVATLPDGSFTPDGVYLTVAK
jgi:uncharacterized protein (TIGR03437 family)